MSQQKIILKYKLKYLYFRKNELIWRSLLEIYVIISCLSKLNICALDKILFLQNIEGQYNPIHTTNIVKYMYDNQLALPGLTQMTDKDTCCFVYSLVRNLYQQQDTKIKYFCLKAFEAQIFCWVLIHQKSSEIALFLLDLSGDSWFSCQNLNKQSFYLWVLFQYLAAE